MPMEALNAFLQNVMVTWSAYPLHIWEVICPETRFHEWYFTFPHSFLAVTMGSKLGHNNFLPHLLRSVIHWSLLFTGHYSLITIHYSLYSLVTIHSSIHSSLFTGHSIHWSPYSLVTIHWGHYLLITIHWSPYSLVTLFTGHYSLITIQWSLYSLITLFTGHSILWHWKILRLLKVLLNK